MKRSPISAASAIGITSKPSINASKARTGSTSVTITLDPIPFALNATPRPTQPNPGEHWHIFPCPRQFDAAGRREGGILDQTQDSLKMESPIFQLYIV